MVNSPSTSPIIDQNCGNEGKIEFMFATWKEREKDGKRCNSSENGYSTGKNK